MSVEKNITPEALLESHLASLGENINEIVKIKTESWIILLE